MHQSAPPRSAPVHARRNGTDHRSAGRKGPVPRARAATAFKACPTAPEALERAAVEAIAAVAADPAMGPKEVRVLCALTRRNRGSARTAPPRQHDGGSVKDSTPAVPMTADMSAFRNEHETLLRDAFSARDTGELAQ